MITQEQHFEHFERWLKKFISKTFGLIFLHFLIPNEFWKWARCVTAVKGHVQTERHLTSGRSWVQQLDNSYCKIATYLREDFRGHSVSYYYYELPVHKTCFRLGIERNSIGDTNLVLETIGEGNTSNQLQILFLSFLLIFWTETKELQSMNSYFPHAMWCSSHMSMPRMSTPYARPSCFWATSSFTFISAKYCFSARLISLKFSK